MVAQGTAGYRVCVIGGVLAGGIRDRQGPIFLQFPEPSLYASDAETRVQEMAQKVSEAEQKVWRLLLFAFARFSAGARPVCGIVEVHRLASAISGSQPCMLLCLWPFCIGGCAHDPFPTPKLFYPCIVHVEGHVEHRFTVRPLVCASQIALLEEELATAHREMETWRSRAERAEIQAEEWEQKAKGTDNLQTRV